MSTLSPLDGRYAKSVEALLPYFSEEALNKARLEIEIRYFVDLSREKGVPELKPIGSDQEKALMKILNNFSEKDAAEIKALEKTTNHDVKAVEYFLKSRMEKIKGLKESVEFVHFGLTSEDVNNLSYGILIHRALLDVILPSLADAVTDLAAIASDTAETQLLSLTHGQPATPSTLGKEMTVFVDRLGRQMAQLSAFMMQGKFGGAVGNFSAHRAAYPAVDWRKFGVAFVESLGLEPLVHTTQINPHDDLAELSHIVFRLNTVSINLCRDIWSYVSRGVFHQRVVKGETGSSTMPHKVNPIDFENAEGNFGLSNALFAHFAEKLPISRLQRDLSDSTVQRSIGVAFGYHLLAVQSLRKGLKKLQVDKAAIAAELDAHPEVYGEAIQTVLRKNGIAGYEKLKELTRGEKVTKETLKKFITALKIPESDKKRLLGML